MHKLNRQTSRRLIQARPLRVLLELQGDGEAAKVHTQKSLTLRLGCWEPQGGLHLREMEGMLDIEAGWPSLCIAAA